MKQIVIAKCVACGSKKEIKANEIPQGEMPTCNMCFSPMVAERAELREDLV